MEDGNNFVFDASAILALLYRESGHARVQERLADSLVSAVNLSEAGTKLHEDGHSPEEVKENLDVLGLTVVPFTDLLAMEAAKLRNPTRKIGLSLGDRACLATALELNLPVVTTDRVWKKLNLGLDIRVIR